MRKLQTAILLEQRGDCEQMGTQQGLIATVQRLLSLSSCCMLLA